LESLVTSERTIFWVGPGEDLQAVIDQAPAGSTIYSRGEHKGPIRMKSGVGIHGVSPEEYEARELGHGIRSMTDCVIELADIRVSTGCGARTGRQGKKR
jgi:hypothetical protein